jgi:hypothetical protein
MFSHNFWGLNGSQFQIMDHLFFKKNKFVSSPYLENLNIVKFKSF